MSPPAPLPATPTVVDTPIGPEDTPIPEVTAPILVYFGEDPRLDPDILTDWAESNGWTFAQAPLAEVTDWAGRPGLRAVLIAGNEISPDRIAEFPPDVYFIILEGGEIEPTERVSVLGDPGARRDQLGFLAGMMVGMATARRSVGLLTDGEGALQSVYRMGFIHGLRFACPRCGLVQERAAVANATVMEEARVDAMLILPGADATDAARRMMQAGIWVVWLGDPPPGLPTERLAGWARFAPAPLVLQALAAIVEREDGRRYPYSAEVGGIQYEILREEAISNGRRGFIDRAWERMRAGELGTGVDPATGQER